VAALDVRVSTRDITASAHGISRDRIRAIVRVLDRTAAWARTVCNPRGRASGYDAKASAVKGSFTIDCAPPRNTC